MRGEMDDAFMELVVWAGRRLTGGADGCLVADYSRCQTRLDKACSKFLAVLIG